MKPRCRHPALSLSILCSSLASTTRPSVNVPCLFVFGSFDVEVSRGEESMLESLASVSRGQTCCSSADDSLLGGCSLALARLIESSKDAKRYLIWVSRSSRIPIEMMAYGSLELGPCGGELGYGLTTKRYEAWNRPRSFNPGQKASECDCADGRDFRNAYKPRPIYDSNLN